MLRRSRLLALLAVTACTASVPDDPRIIVDASPTVPDGAAGTTIDAPILVSSDGGGGGGGLIFDPCVANPKPGYEPTGLAGCCTGVGPAHCVPSSQIPTTLAEFLTNCPAGGECMPDSIIRAGGGYRPPTCTSSIVNAPGACLSKCIPLVADNPLAALLRQDGCAEGDVCAPCTNPLDQTPTGACNLIDLLCPAVPDGGVPAVDAGTTAMCPHTGPPIIDPTTLPACAPACGGAHCVPATLVPAAQQLLLSACISEGNLPGLCAPDELITSGGNFIPKSCTSVAGAEGRCLSRCLPDVAEQADLLPRDVCAVSEECVPCFDPTSSSPTTPTGACTLACDKPVKPPVVITCPWNGPDVINPATLPQCDVSCNGAHCVPGTLVPASLQGQLDTCKGGFCTPDPLIASAGEKPPARCRSVAGAEGRCLSTCLPDVREQIDLLPRDSCGATERCVPCFDPTSEEPNAPTGACDIGCDDPNEPPLILTCPWTGPPVVDPSRFSACDDLCAGAHCLPADLVPDDLREQLDACTGGYCTPDPFISTGGNFVARSCTSVAGAEGRCLSTCLPEVRDQLDLLPRAGCAIDERCVPCFDPTSDDPNAPTGACDISCDMPKKPPVVLTCPWTGPAVIDPATFPPCDPACGGAHCLPAEFIPEDQRGLLATCPGGFCAPDPIISSDNHFVPKTCRSVASAEGRCLSTCLPLVKDMALFLPSLGCSPGEECAPCFDPTSSDPNEETGACRIGCDAPKERPVILRCPYTGPAVIDPTILDACDDSCGGAHCLPAMFVPEDKRELLAPCGDDGFCTPDPMIQTVDHWNPPTCTSVAGAEGRCLSTCLPDVNEPLLPDSTCSPGNKCVPCYDPTATDPNLPTGACDLGCDKPARPPTILTCPWQGPAVIDPEKLPPCEPGCTGSHCLPEKYVPEDTRELLATCPGGYCTPDEFIESAGHSVPPPCEPFFNTGAEGRCLSECLPLVSQQGSLEQGDCFTGQKCAPCFDPLTGIETGACGVACDKPEKEPFLFPDCCFRGGDYQGRCVPRSQIDDEDEGRLTEDDCPPADMLCVPNTELPGGTRQSCSTWYGGTSCIPDCINTAWYEDLFLEQSSCPSGYLCVP